MIAASCLSSTDICFFRHRNDPRQPSAYTLERLQLWVLAVIIRMSWLRRVINALSFRVSEWGSRRNQLSEQRSHLGACPRNSHLTLDEEGQE